MRQITSIASLAVACLLSPALAGAVASASDPLHRHAPPPRLEKPLTLREGHDAKRQARAFLAHTPLTARLTASGSHLVARPTQQSLGVAVQRFDQTYRGLPVLGAQAVVRLEQGSVLGSTTDLAPSLSVDTAPRVAPTQAHAFAVARHSVTVAGAPRLIDRGLAVLPRGRGVLVRHVTVLGADRTTRLPICRQVFVAADASTPVLSYSAILPFAQAGSPPDGPVAITARGYNGPALPLVVLRQGGRFLLEDVSRHATISTYRTDADAANLPLDLSREHVISTSNLPFAATASRSGAIDAQWASGQVLDYYADRFGRDSLDGHGMAIRSYVGLTYLGKPMANAAWTGTEMIYGSGDREYKPFSASLDIVGHEMTHGVIQHTSNLLYYGQPGAVNEAFTDYFGNAIGDDVAGIAPDDPRYSLVGEDLCRTKLPVACAKFDIAQRMTTAQYHQSEDDEQGVHRNSPIISTALWGVRLVLGGHVADRLAYAVMTQYLTPSADFTAVRAAMLVAAREQGLTPAEIDTVAASFDSNGVVRGWDRFRLEPGVHLARTGLAYPSSLIDLRNHTLVTTDMRRGREVVLAGSPADDGARVLTGLTSDVIGDIATNGREVIALGGRVRGFHQTSTVRVSSLTGGPARTLADITGHARSVLKVAIGRGVYAWQTRAYAPDGVRDVLVVARRNGRVDRLSAQGGTFGAWSLSGRQVVFTDAHSTRVGSFNAGTGRLRTLWAMRARADFRPRATAIALAPHRLVVAADRRPGPTTSVLTFDRSGGHRRLILGERGSSSQVVKALDASDRAITAALPQHRLVQVDAQHGHGAPVTCLPVRFAWTQGGGQRVAWTQQQFGNTAVAIRSHPRRPQACSG